MSQRGRERLLRVELRWDAGQSKKQIAADYGVAWRNVAEWFKRARTRYGPDVLPARPLSKGANNQEVRQKNADQFRLALAVRIEPLRSLWAEGKTMRQMAEILGLTFSQLASRIAQGRKTFGANTFPTRHASPTLGELHSADLPMAADVVSL